VDQNHFNWPLTSVKALGWLNLAWGVRRFFCRVSTNAAPSTGLEATGGTVHIRKSAMRHRITTATAVTLASLAAVGVQTTAAHAADTYYCSTPLDLGQGISVDECIHLGGNGYWQPYLQIHNGWITVLGLSNDKQWINSGGAFNAYKPIPYTEAPPGTTTTIWGASTNWRNTCYVQGQAFVDFPGQAYQLNSPSEEVC
jgi:hypothetical protein